MPKITLYPKTQRYDEDSRIQITEKIDGSNLTLFKLDDDLYIGQRNNVFKWDADNPQSTYKGLNGWLAEHGEQLRENLHSRSAIIGEWVGMGRLKYPKDFERFQMFAKGNIKHDFVLSRLNYDRDDFIYPFIDQEIPDFIGVVPHIVSLVARPTVEELDTIYDEYRLGVERDVEGFVLNNANHITKYVRMKNGTVEPHFSRGNNPDNGNRKLEEQK